MRNDNIQLILFFLAYLKTNVPVENRLAHIDFEGFFSFFFERLMILILMYVSRVSLYLNRNGNFFFLFYQVNVFFFFSFLVIFYSLMFAIVQSEKK
jgi:hypothetical protein